MKRYNALFLGMLIPVILAPTCVVDGDVDVDDDEDGYTEAEGDCDDTDDQVYPGRVWLNGSYHGTSVQSAISATTSGAWDEVLACGQFSENIDFGTRIKVRLEGYYAEDGEGGIIPATTVQRVNLIDVGLIVIDGVSFVDGEAPSSLDYRGGCMNVNGSGGIVIHNSILGNCHADAHGGGAYVNNSNVTFNDVHVLDNYADDKGSGLYVRGSSTLNFNGGSVQDQSGHNGLYLRDTDGDPTAELDDVDFDDNVTCDVSFESSACITLGAAYSGTCTEGACD